MLSRSLLLGVLLLGAAALAQDAGVDFDAATPDASVGTGGTDTNNQEMEDSMSNTVCAQSRDCERGFSCNNGRCTYNGFRTATCGGCGGPMSALLLPVAGLLRWRRRKP